MKCGLKTWKRRRRRRGEEGKEGDMRRKMRSGYKWVLEYVMVMVVKEEE